MDEFEKWLEERLRIARKTEADYREYQETGGMSTRREYFGHWRARHNALADVLLRYREFKNERPAEAK